MGGSGFHGFYEFVCLLGLDKAKARTYLSCLKGFFVMRK